MKTCSKCGSSGPDELFVNPRKGRRVLTPRCKSCVAANNRAWYLKNKEYVKQRSKSYAEKHPEIYRKAGLRNYYKHWHARRKNNKEWIKRNLPKLAAYHREKRKTDIQYLIRSRMRSRIHCALNRRGSKKSNSTMDLIGCSKSDLMAHIESQFKPGMCWNNMGLWHIDHIRPMASFNLLEESELREAMNYKNLQPLWASENLSKGSRYDANGIVSTAHSK